MVFESLVSSLLNKFLGDYVENLDSSQLNLGIWGGDVVLTNLNIKPTALDNLDLPIKLKSGYLSKLTLKIPWTSLYTAPVLADIEGLYVLAVPNVGVKYDADKENKQTQDAKQAELQKVDDARKAKKKKETEKDKPPPDDTFTEKMITQIIKNLQVTIKDIHVRYEDQYTNKKRPFAVGLTLHSLFFQTTDENWKPMIIKESVKLIYKLVDLDSLALYWNNDAKLISELKSNDQIRDAMKDMIATKDYRPKEFTYMLAPISISTKLKLNQKPETDGTNFQTPKILLELSIKEIGLNIGKYQYQDILEFLEAQERLTLNAKYRKYRPDLKEYKKHAKEWWHFAMTCILEDTVKRKNRNWSWEHMKQHRQLCKKYKNAWIDKLTNKSPSKDSIHTIEVAEKQLDVFNLNVSRQQAELEIDRRGLTRVEDQQGWVGWATSWWSGGKKKEKSEEDLTTQFEKAMTPEERAKLYEALDYQENQSATAYPKEFVENKILFSLENLVVVVHDDIAKGQRVEVITMSLQKVGADIEQRPSAQAIKIVAKMQTFRVEGIREGGRPAPVIASSVSKSDGGEPQVAAFIETNPLNGSCDQYVKLKVLPQNVVYHAPSINKLIVVFRPPESVRLKQLTAAAMAKYEDIKVRSATGLSYALEKRSRLKLDIVVLPCCVQIPETGIMEKTSSVLVLDLGTLCLSTVDTGNDKLDESFYKKSEEDKIKDLMEKAYDKFKIELKSLQILFASSKDDWQSARSQPKTNLHVLHPTGFEIVMKKAAIVDLRIPQLQISGNLPDLNINLSDIRLLMLLKLLMSIPTPPPPPPGEVSTIEDIVVAEPDLRTKAKMHAIMEVNEAELNLEDEEESVAAPVKSTKSSETEKLQQVALELTLVLNKVSINISRIIADVETPYIGFGLRSIGVDFKMRSLDMIAVVFLGDVEFEHKQFQDFKGTGPLYILKSATKYSPEKPLLRLEYVQADKKSPFFASDYGMIEQKVKITSEPLTLCVHQEALVDMKLFADYVQSELAKIKPPTPPSVTAQSLAPSSQSGSNLLRAGRASLSNISQRSFSLAEQRRKRMRETASALDEHIINMKLESTLKGLDIILGNKKRVFSVVTANGLDATVIMRPKTLQALVVLPSISITDPNPDARYSKILSVEGKEVFRLEFIQFNRSDEEKTKMKVDEYDMGVKLNFAEMRFVFLNLWLNNMLGFLAPFQEAAAAAASQAGAALSEGAKIATEQFKELHVSKIKLDIVINAPVVIIPQNSKSDEALLAHFGKLSVVNKFDDVKSKKSTSDLIILDEMAVKLTDMKVARVVLGADGMTVVAECHLLDPVTFMLTLSRNLSYSVSKEKPELAIFAKLPHLKVTASQEDYGMLMKVLNENLAEGTPPKPAPPVKPASGTAEPPTTDTPASGGGTTSSSDKDKVIVEVDRHATADGGPPSPDSSASKMEFSFEVEEISAFLYIGSSNLDKGVAQRARKKAFAGIQISHISVKGRMMDDTSMNADVILHSLTMDDCREGQIGITRLMDKKGNSAKSINVMDVSYRKSAAGDQKADIIMRPFFFCVCPEFLGALAQFFTVPASTAAPPAVDEAGRTTASSKQPAATTAKKKLESMPGAPPAAPPSVMEVSIVVEDPEVVLVEDASKPDSTQAVILQFKANFSLKQSPDQTAMDGGITDLEIFSSYYSPALRDLNKKHVLNPCEITLAGSMTTENGQHIDVTFSDIVMRISPSVIRLLSAVGAGMSTPQEESIRDKKAKIVARQHVWDVKNIKDCNFWYLKEVLGAEEATETVELDELPPIEKQEQQLVVSMEVFMFTLEADAGSGTVPMILLTSSFTANVQNWSSELEVDGDLTLEMAYFNEKFNVWEPLIEPIEVKNGYRPWQLTLRVQTNNEYEMMDDEQVLPPPKMEICLISTDTMNITVTKICLELITKLSDAFNKAYKNVPPTKSSAIELEFPYVVTNDAGLDVEILPSEAFELPPSYAVKALPYNEYIPLTLKFEEPSVHTITARQENTNEYKLNIRLPDKDLNTVREVDVTRAEKRLFVLPKTTHPGDQWQMLVDISSHYGKKLITLRSIINVQNHLPLPVEVYYQIDTNLDSCGIVDAGGEINLPMKSVYTPTGDLFFRPVDEQYDVSKPAINWHSFDGNLSTANVLQCAGSSSDVKAVFYIQVWAELENALFENTNRKNLNTHCYTIHLRPPVTFHNVLPFSIQVLAPKTPNPVTIHSGESSSLYSVCPGQSLIEVKVLAGVGVEWFCKIRIEETSDELTAHTFRSKRSDNSYVEMDLGIRTTMNQGSRDMSLYCPFWMVNKTGLPLAYKDEALKVSGCSKSSKSKKSQSCPCISGAASGKHVIAAEGEAVELPTEHPADLTDPVLFTFNGKNFFDKKKACIKVGDSEWSDKFPVDTVGSAGRIVCKTNRGRDIEVSLTIQLSNSGLTKICTFTPFYMINNHCNANIEVREDKDGADWIPIPPSKCVPFWPVQTGKQMFMFVRYGADPFHESLSFPFHESFEAFVSIKNEFVGVDVDCHITEGSAVIEISDYQDGMAPALIINDIEGSPVTYTQEGVNSLKTLSPGTCALFCWERMSGKREILWSCGEKKNIKDGLYKDGTGDFTVESSTGTVTKAYWVSFLDGRQRVLLFTEDLAVATVAQAYEAERIDTQIVFSLQGILVSLVNNALNAEICLIGIKSSGLIWEFKKKRWKAFSLKECRELEAAHNQYELELKANKKVKARRTVDKMDVDFSTMMQHKPDRRIQRSLQVGLWIQYKLSTHQQQLHLKLNHFQIDNQLPACVFPVVFAPVPPPKSVAAESIPKPFCEVSFVARKAEHSTVPQIKYFKVLVQEMALQADQGFINSMLAFVGSDQGVSVYNTELYRKDHEITQQDLVAFASATSSTEQKAFYDSLHFSPIKVHLSFSQGGSAGDSGNAKKGGGLQIHSEFFNLFLKSVGVTLTEIQDVVFKLAYFEREAVFYNQSQLISEVGSHYAKQAFKQLYVLVLGLDIIGNPFGLVRDLSTGVETLFYEPFQGAIQGPEEFAEGLALGVKSLFGHAVGGAAGAVSRITGTLGKGLAALTMDDEYQKKRQEMLNRRPANVREGFMQGGKGLVTGVYDGVTGVFLKPVEGFKKEGGLGLVKGVGKGLVGLVTRPTSGLVDFASQSFESVRKVTDVNTEVKKMRNPRYIHPDKIVRPFSAMEAEGNQMLHAIDKGKFITTDNFIGFSPLTADKKFYIIVTDKRIMTVSKNDLFGNMEVDWDYVWKDLASAPTLGEKGLQVKLKEPKKKILGVFGSSSGGKLVHFPDNEIAKWITEKCEHAYRLESDG